MLHYGGDVRFFEGVNLTPGDFKALVCEELGLCASIGCHGCGLGTDPEISCKDLCSDAHAPVPYELKVGASEGPSSGTSVPGWLVLAWWSRTGLHFELNLDEGTSFAQAASLWIRLRQFGYLSVTSTNRTAEPAEHPAASQPTIIDRGY